MKEKVRLGLSLQVQLLLNNPNKTLQLQQTFRRMLWDSLEFQIRQQTKPLLWDLREWMRLMEATSLLNQVLCRRVPQGAVWLLRSCSLRQRSWFQAWPWEN